MPPLDMTVTTVVPKTIAYVMGVPLPHAAPRARRLDDVMGPLVAPVHAYQADVVNAGVAAPVVGVPGVDGDVGVPHGVACVGLRRDAGHDGEDLARDGLDQRLEESEGGERSMAQAKEVSITGNCPPLEYATWKSLFPLFLFITITCVWTAGICCCQPYVACVAATLPS